MVGSGVTCKPVSTAEVAYHRFKCEDDYAHKLGSFNELAVVACFSVVFSDVISCKLDHRIRFPAGTGILLFFPTLIPILGPNQQPQHRPSI